VFAHLHCHSHYSFLRGVSPPEEIIAAAVEQKMPAVALTDTNGLYAAVPFYQAAKTAGVKPIVGVTLDVEWPENQTEIPSSARNEGSARSVGIVLLAEDMEGYSNLCQLVTLGHLGTTELAKSKECGADGGPPVTRKQLAEHSRGVIALCPLPARMHQEGHRWGTARRAPAGMEAADETGRPCRAPTKTAQRTAHEQRQELSGTDDGSPTASHFAQLKDIFAERLWIEVHHLSPGDRRMLREAERIGRELGVPLVATNNVYFLRPEEHLHHRAVNAVRTGGLLTTVAAPDITSGEAWFKPAAEMERLFPDHPELPHATLEIAERCNLELTLNKTIFPEFPVPEGESAFSYLWKLCFAGARRRYRPLLPEVLSRLTHELGVIEKLHLAPFDAITLWHTFEHLTGLRATLEDIRRLLSANGVLIIAVPNAGGLQAGIFGSQWFHLDVPRHLYHFTRSALVNLLQSEGFLPSREWHQEFEYDLLGWSQSALNLLAPGRPNLFFDLLRGFQPPIGKLASAAAWLSGALLMALTILLVPVGTLIRRGGTLIISARPHGRSVE